MDTTYVILTGGKSTRFGSDKSKIELGGMTLIDRILQNLPAGEVIIVGPKFEQKLRTVAFVQEEPLGGGPVAAISAALALVKTSEVCIIATDMPFAGQIVSTLTAISLDCDAIVPLDQKGMRQPMCARYRSAALAKAIASLGDPTGKSMRAVLSQLEITEFTPGFSLASKLVDVDTRDDLEGVMMNLREELDRQ